MATAAARAVDTSYVLLPSKTIETKNAVIALHQTDNHEELVKIICHDIVRNYVSEASQ